MFNNSGGQSGPSKGIRFSFLTPTDQAKFEQLFIQSASASGGNKIPANTVSELLRRSNLDNDSLAKIWDLASVANAPYLTFPEFAVAMFLTSKKLTGQVLPASLPPNVREETEVAIATIASTESSQQLVNTNIQPQPPQQQFMNQPMTTGIPSQMTGMPSQMTGMPSQMTGMQPQMTGMTGMRPQLSMMTGMSSNQLRPTPPPVAQLPMQTGYMGSYQAPMQTGFQPSMPPAPKPRLQNLDFAKKMMPNQNGNTNLLNPHLGTSEANKISWKISPEDKQRYREIFQAWEGSGSGFMSGDTAKDVLTQSQLPPADLMKIWNLADNENKGSLDIDEFAIAMHLVYRKLNGFEIPSVLPPELAPPSSLLKKFVLGRRPPPSTPSFGTNSPKQREVEQDDDEYSPYGRKQHDYVSSSRRKGPQSASSARPYSARYHSDSDDEADVLVLEDLRRQIAETQRSLDRMPEIQSNSTSSYSGSSKYSLEELKEKIRRAQDDINQASRNNPAASKYFENSETLMGLLETQKSLQDEIQYLCNRDIPVLARQLRSSAAELRDTKVRHSRKNDGTQDFMAFIQPTGPGGSITESDRVRAKAKAMMAARKSGNSGSSTDAGFGLRRAEEEKEEADRKADTIERDMEKSRTALLDMRGDLRYLEEMTAAKDLEDKKRFENGQDLSYELRRFIEQLESKASEPSSYAPRLTSNFKSSPTIGSNSTSSYQSPSLASSSPKPKTAPARPRTAEEIKKEAERRVQERLAAIQAKRNPNSSRSVTPATPRVSKPNVDEEAAQQRLRDAEREAQELLRTSVGQRAEVDRKNREAELERIRESEQLESQRVEDMEREAKENDRRNSENEEQRRIEEERDLEERRRQVLAKEEAERQARFDAIRREEEAEEARKAQKAEHKPEHKPEEAHAASTSTSPPPPPAPIASTPAAIVATPSPIDPNATTSSNNPFAKFQQTNTSTTAAPTGSSQAEKPNEPANKRVSYNPFAAFSAFSATKAGDKDDNDSEDDGWDVGHDDSEDENEFPAAGSAKNLAGMLFNAMSKRGDPDLETVREASPKPDDVGSGIPPAPPAPSEDSGIPPPPPPPAPAAPSAPVEPSSPALAAPAGGDTRNALLSQIQSGTKLKKATTKDRSASSIAGHVIDDSSNPVQSTFAPAEIAAPVPISAPLSSGGFLAELQARTGGSSPSIEHAQNSETSAAAEEPVTTQDKFLPEHEYIALWDYSGSGADDLAFSQDDVILIRDNNEAEDWWFGTLKKTQKSGYFPRNYVQLKPEAIPDLNIKAKALYDFEGAEGQGCLDFKMGDNVTILVKENDDWWKAQSDDGRIGLVPANYLEV